MVDPRQERPCHTELETIFQEQLRFQDLAVKRVAEIEKVGDEEVINLRFY